jgi:hypothetical protein
VHQARVVRGGERGQDLVEQPERARGGSGASARITSRSVWPGTYSITR